MNYTINEIPDEAVELSGNEMIPIWQGETKKVSVATLAGYVQDADSYSTTETLTGGKWIDGKPIYRRVSTATGSASGWGNILVNDFNAQTILKCFAIESGNFTSVPSYVTTNQSGYIRCFFSSGGISVGATVVLEYTKTTD